MENFTFGFKIEKRHEHIGPDFVELQHINGRNAYYSIDIAKESISPNPSLYTVWSVYGKLNTNYQRRKIGKFESLNKALELRDQKIVEKLEKGYEIIKKKTK